MQVNFSNLRRITKEKCVNTGFNLPKVLLSNPRSINNKLDELEIILRDHVVDIVALTETWEVKDSHLELLSLDGFATFSRPREKRQGGGVALFAKHIFHPRLLTDTLYQMILK